MLTLKQKRFVQFYEGNASEAARKAGYSIKTANEQGAQLLAKLSIQDAIHKRLTKKDAVTIASRKERQEFWSKTMNDSSCDLNTRLRASELLGKSEADFTENVNHTGEINIYEILKKFDLETIVGLKNRVLESMHAPNN